VQDLPSFRYDAKNSNDSASSDPWIRILLGFLGLLSLSVSNLPTFVGKRARSTPLEPLEMMLLKGTAPT
jgi:hypothetical protein